MEGPAFIHIDQDEYREAVPFGKTPYSQTPFAREVRNEASGVKQGEPNVFLGEVSKG